MALGFKFINFDGGQTSCLSAFIPKDCIVVGSLSGLTFDGGRLIANVQSPTGDYAVNPAGWRTL